MRQWNPFYLFILLGVLTLGSASSTLAVTLQFDTDGTVAVPAGVTEMKFSAWGGGGSGSTGGGGGSQAGGGGGGGASCEQPLVTVVPGETLTINIGEGAITANASGLSTSVSGSTTGAILTIAGGAAGGNSGGDGGSFSAATCAGGTGFDGGAGGSRSGTGATHGGGGGGGSATVLAAGGQGGGGVASTSGGAGGTGEGNGGDGGEPDAGGNPTDGQAPGGGGGGQGGGTVGQFGSGANGRVIVEYAVCGNGVVELNEQCDDGNTDAGDCCSAACTYEAAASTCGDTGTECVVQDTCDGAGNCDDNGFVTSGTGCGSSTTNACTAADTCDGAGNCQANDSAVGTNCGDAGTECTVQDTCDGSGSCTDNGFQTSGTNCGDAGTECTLQDTCDGSGSCTDNGFVTSGTNCGDAGTECTIQDTCDGFGSCTDNGFQTSGTNCGDAGTECTVQDTCDGSGSCTDNGFASSGVSCGSSTTDECTAADTCDGSGTCESNDAVAGTNCGDAGTECTIQDTCDGSGSCTDNGFEANGTSCGDAADTTCTAPDTCDGAGACDSNNAAGGTACDDGLYCTDGDACDGSGSCQSGAARDCNDADLCTADSCDEAGNTCVNEGVPVEPATCYSSTKGNILFKDKGDPAKIFIKWKWKKGEPVDPIALGSPSTATEYALCIYDQTAASPTLIGSYGVPVSNLWKEKTGQVLYFNKPGAPDGVAQIKGKASLADGKSGMAAKVAGTNMLAPTPYSGDEFVDADPSVIIQMLNSEGACWSNEFTAEQLKANSPTSLRGVF